MLDGGLASYAETPWVEVRSPAFRILSQSGVHEAREVCNHAEVFRAVVALVTNARRADPRVPTAIFAFDSMAAVGRFGGKRNIAGLMSPGMRDNVALVFTGRAREMTAQNVIFHEYTHLVLRNENDVLYPMWYDEGLAEFFGALRIDDDRVIIGAFPRYRETTALYANKLPMREVVTARSLERWSAEKISAFYLQSWLLTHYLTLGRPRAEGGRPSPLSRYLMHEVPPAQSERAWQEVFGSDFGQLEHQLDAYAGDGRIPAKSLPRASLATDSCGEARTVGKAEVARELGWLALRLGHRSEARALFEATLRDDPTDARAHAGVGDVAKLEGRWEDAPPHYQRALDLAPDDPRNHLELAEWAVELPVERGGGTAENIALAREHLAAALRLAPESAETYAVLAQTYLRPGEDPNAGLEYAQRAAQLLPSNEQVQLTLAQVYMASGHRDAARRRLTRLAAWSHATLASRALQLLAVLDGAPSAAGDGHPGDPQGGRGGGAEP